MTGRPARARASASASAPVAAPVRRLLLLAAVLVFLAGLQLFVFTLHTERYFAWTVGSPMTAVFLGASYWAAIALELGGALAPSWERAKIAVPAVFAFTVLTLLVTLWHLDAFHLGSSFELRTQLITWGWIAVYAIVPVLLVVAVTGQAAAPVTEPADRRPVQPLPTAVRVLLVTQAVTLLGLGVALLLAPGWADGAWPWPLTALTGRAVGAWLVGLGVGATHAWLLDDVLAVRPLALTGVVFVVAQSVALARHGDELEWASAPAAGFVIGLAVIGLTSAWVLLLARRSVAPG